MKKRKNMVINFKLEESLLIKIKEFAKIEDRRISEIIRTAIKEYINK